MPQVARHSLRLYSGLVIQRHGLLNYGNVLVTMAVTRSQAQKSRSQQVKKGVLFKQKGAQNAMPKVQKYESLMVNSRHVANVHQGNPNFQNTAAKFRAHEHEHKSQMNDGVIQLLFATGEY